MTGPKLTEKQYDTVRRIANSLDSDEKLLRFITLIEHETDIISFIDDMDLLKDMAQKERNYMWLKKTARDTATLFLAVSAALYGMYEVWVRVISDTVKKVTGN